MHNIKNYLQKNKAVLFIVIFVAGIILGVIYTLLIFHINIGILPTFPVNAELIFEILTALGTIGAVFVALFKDPILKNWFGYRPELQIIDSMENIQNEKGYTRILFENKGKITASDVEVYVSKIYDNGKPREDFIPVPLYWTHVGKTKRDFHPNQYGFLDVCQLDLVIRGRDIDGKIRYYGNGFPKLTIEGGAHIPTYEEIYQFTDAIELTIFQKSGMVKKVKVHLNWRRQDPLVIIFPIEKLN